LWLGRPVNHPHGAFPRGRSAIATLCASAAIASITEEITPMATLIERVG
jgi:hypothetical protein